MAVKVEAPVRGYRNGHKKSQSEVAQALGISRNWYGKKEAGEIPFDTNEIMKFADFFGEDVRDILHLFFYPPTSHIAKCSNL